MLCPDLHVPERVLPRPHINDVIRSSTIGPVLGGQLAQVVASAPNLVSLVMPGIGLCDGGVKALAKAVATNASLAQVGWNKCGSLWENPQGVL